MIAVIENSSAAVSEALIKAGADVNAENKNFKGENVPYDHYYNAIQYAARYNPSGKVIEALVKAGADPNVTY